MVGGGENVAVTGKTLLPRADGGPVAEAEAEAAAEQQQSISISETAAPKDIPPSTVYVERAWGPPRSPLHPCSLLSPTSSGHPLSSFDFNWQNSRNASPGSSTPGTGPAPSKILAQIETDTNSTSLPCEEFSSGSELRSTSFRLFLLRQSERGMSLRTPFRTFLND